MDQMYRSLTDRGGNMNWSGKHRWPLFFDQPSVSDSLPSFSMDLSGNFVINLSVKLDRQDLWDFRSICW